MTTSVKNIPIKNPSEILSQPTTSTINHTNSISGYGTIFADKFSEISNSTTQFFNRLSGTVTDKLSERFGKGTFIGDNFLATTKLINDHALHLGYAGAAVGGLTLTSSTINLLQKKADNNLKTEALKILFGSTLIGLSAAYAAKDPLETSKIVNVALGSALLNAVWRACIVVKPTIKLWVLKSVDSNEQIPSAKNMASFFEKNFL